MQRIPEPELMDGEAQAKAYAGADFGEPNAAFVEELEALWPGAPEELLAVDLGCGPADIPVRIARRHPGWRIDAVDGAPAMLAYAERAVRREGLEDTVRLWCSELASLPLAEGAYDLILSNSLLHHLHDPDILWRAVRRLARPGARLLVMDLSRPSDPDTARRLVDEHAADEPEVLRRDFLSSLHAAFTPDEVRVQLGRHGLDDLDVRRTSDRHLLIRGPLPG